MKKAKYAILSVLAASLMLVVGALAQGAPTIPWSAIGGGGAEVGRP